MNYPNQATTLGHDPYAAARNTATQVSNALDELQQQADAIQQRADMVLDRVQRVLDRAFGPSPEKSSTGAPTPVPNGAVDMLKRKLAGIDTVTERLAEAVNRLDTLV